MRKLTSSLIRHLSRIFDRKRSNDPLLYITQPYFPPGKRHYHLPFPSFSGFGKISTLGRDASPRAASTILVPLQCLIILREWVDIFFKNVAFRLLAEAEERHAIPSPMDFIAGCFGLIVTKGYEHAPKPRFQFINHL